MKIVVLDGFAVNPGDLSWDFLKKYGEVEVFAKTPNEDACKNVSGAAAVFTNRVNITEEMLEKNPSIKYVSALGTGYDMIDIAACKKHGVCVCNVPSYSSDSVAQMAATLLLNLSTDLNGLCQIVKDGMWTGIPGFMYQTVRFSELADKTVGIIGYGGIGRRMAEICAALKMRVLAHTPRKTSGGDAVAKFAELDFLLENSDYVSFHCPLTDETRGMVNRQFISKMKDGARIINTSRGAVLCEADVADALNSGKLGGAALDVLATEPALKSNPLLKAKNCIITPHAAWTTIESRKRLIDILDKNLDSFVNTGKGINQIV